jgi:hypothetical protein
MTFLYCHTVNNPGDKFSSPKLYFQDWINCDRAYPDQTEKIPPPPEPILIGGGGMFMAETDQIYDRIIANRWAAVWGAGSNFIPYEAEWHVPEALQRCKLVGVRDYGQKHRYVPCASCLHPVFLDQIAEPEFDYILYFHHDHQHSIEGPLKLLNDQPNIEWVIKQLSRGKTIITTSYHGAYWAMLLNRTVVVLHPWGNKFRFFKYKPSIATINNWKDFIKGEPVNPPDFLSECRKINLEFRSDVNESLKANQEL